MSTKTKTRKIELKEPFKIGETEVRELVLRRPTPGDLRGLAVSQLANMDADTFYEFLPRIISPAMTEDQVIEHLDLAGLVKTMAAVSEFLQGK